MLWLIQAAPQPNFLHVPMQLKSESVSDMTQSDQLSPSDLSDVDLAPSDMAAQERKQFLNVTYVFLSGFKTSTLSG